MTGKPATVQDQLFKNQVSAVVSNARDVNEPQRVIVIKGMKIAARADWKLKLKEGAPAGFHRFQGA